MHAIQFFNHKQKGFTLVITLFFLAIFLTISVAYLNFVINSAQSAGNDVKNSQALTLAEAGIDEAISQLNQNVGYSGKTGAALSEGTFTVVISSVATSSKEIVATGYVPDGAGQSWKTVGIIAAEETSSTTSKTGTKKVWRFVPGTYSIIK